MSEKLRPTNPDKILSEITLIAELQSEGQFESAEFIRRDLVHEVKARTRVDLDKRLQPNED